MSDDAKTLVLARRAKFVAAALAGMTLACGKERAPHPCLDVAPSEDSSVRTPQPCLSAAPPPTPAPCLSAAAPPQPPVWDPTSGPTTTTTGDRDAASPRQCLSVVRDPPQPHPCLSALPPKGCEQPYTIDAQGKKHYKKECL